MTTKPSGYRVSNETMKAREHIRALAEANVQLSGRLETVKDERDKAEAELADAEKELAWVNGQVDRWADWGRKKQAEVERLKAALKEHGCDWYGDRHGGGRESDTSGEASPTRVASPPHKSVICARCRQVIHFPDIPQRYSSDRRRWIHSGGCPPAANPAASSIEKVPPRTDVQRSTWMKPNAESVWCYKHVVWEDGPYGCLADAAANSAARKERDGHE